MGRTICTPLPVVLLELVGGVSRAHGAPLENAVVQVLGVRKYAAAGGPGERSPGGQSRRVSGRT